MDWQKLLRGKIQATLIEASKARYQEMEAAAELGLLKIGTGTAGPVPDNFEAQRLIAQAQKYYTDHRWARLDGYILDNN